MSKATDEALGELHGAVARALTDAITEGVDTPVKGAEGETTIVKTPASAAYFAAAITFLKNNNITAAPGNSDLDKLKQALANKRTAKAPSLTPQALDEAAELFGNRLQ